MKSLTIRLLICFQSYVAALVSQVDTRDRPGDERCQLHAVRDGFVSSGLVAVTMSQQLIAWSIGATGGQWLNVVVAPR